MRALALALALTLSVAGRAAAQTPGCTTEITTLPYTITTSGVYCLKQSHMTNLASGAAITVGGFAISTTIDLRGFTINNQVAGAGSTAIGVLAAGKSSVTVRNGRIQSFRSGVTLDSVPPNDTRGNVVENVHVHRPYVSGIVMHGRGHQVRNCTVTSYGEDGSSGAFGILVDGEGLLIEGNAVADSYTTSGYGITVSGTNNQVVGNRVLNPQHHGLFLVGTSNTKYRDNLVTGAAVAYEGGIDAGNNP
jgi:Right handed beta helix region